MPKAPLFGYFLCTTRFSTLLKTCSLSFPEILPVVCHLRVGKSVGWVFPGKYLLLPKLQYFGQSLQEGFIWENFGNVFFKVLSKFL